jgi:hypothetical protein
MLKTFALFALTICFATQASVATELRRNVVAAGGGSLSSASYTLTSTVGQSVVGVGAGITLELSSGFWSGGTSGATGIDDLPDDGSGNSIDDLPTQHHLYQNVPNPFSRSTTIRYDLPRSAATEIRIYDVSGRLVRTFANASEPAGRQQLHWDGRDSRGRDVSAGVFLYVIETPDYRSSRKMVLLH